MWHLMHQKEGLMIRPSGSAALVLVDASTPLHSAPALFDAMLEGWRMQQMARRLSPAFIRSQELTVRRFQDFTGCWPWQWRPEQLESWIAGSSWSHSTIRCYAGSLSLFLDYVCDPRYGWVEACWERVGETPARIFHERNTSVHVSESEGRPQRRPLSRAELQDLFDLADDRVAEAAASTRKGWLTTFRDATLFKVIYAFGLRRREAAALDVGDFTVNPAALEFGTFGVCQVRFGKAMRGSPPRRRAVLTVMPWIVGVLEQYVEQVRPLNGEAARQPAL
jgi:integrase/recombinase XerC